MKTTRVNRKLREPLSPWFWNQLKHEPSGCWEWTRCRTKLGYGKVLAYGKVMLAHRVAYALHCGEMTKDCVLHRCDNPPCCNPDHLFIGTRLENNRDAAQKGRHVSPSFHGEQHPAAKLTNKDIPVIRSRYASGDSYRKIAIDYGVSTGAIGWIIRRQTWAFIPD